MDFLSSICVGGDFCTTDRIYGLIASCDNRSGVTTPSGQSSGVRFDFKCNTTDGLNDGGNFFGEMTFRPYGTGNDFTGGNSHQLGFTDNGNIWHRIGTNGTWGTWTQVNVGGDVSTASVCAGACVMAGTCICAGTTMYASTCVSSPVVYASTCVSSPVVYGSTRVTSPTVCGSTCVTSPVVCGSTRVTSPTVCGSTCVTSPTVCGTLSVNTSVVNAVSFVNSTVALCAVASSCTILYYAGTAKLCTVTQGICLGANCGFGTDFIATSDCRLKTDIQPISNALSMVMKLQGVCYHDCDDKNCEQRIGLIAQDVEKVIPEVVSHSAPSDDDAKYGITDTKLGLKYGKITAVLIEAIKEQQLKITELENKINNK